MNNNNQMMNNNNQIINNNMNNNINNYNQINKYGSQEHIELDFMRKQIKIYEERISSLEELIRQKDLEISNLKYRLSSNFCINQNMQSFNNLPIMMGQMNNLMNNINQINANNILMNERNNNSPKNLTLNFILLGSKDGKISIQCRSNEKMETIFKRFRIKLCDDEFRCSGYFFKGKEINKDLTVDESGISNEDEIFVVDENDERNQKRKMLEKFSLKPERHLIFCSSKGFKTHIFVTKDTKVGEAIKIYLKKVEVGKNFMILFNGMQLDINDDREIEEIFGGKDNIIFTVYDLDGIIGA
jgi:hypothetical protein